MAAVSDAIRVWVEVATRLSVGEGKTIPRAVATLGWLLDAVGVPAG